MSEARYLGFTIDEKWNYKKHVKNLITRLRKMMPCLYKVCKVLNKKNKLNLYYAWIESILRYGIEVYGFAPESVLEKIQKVQKILFKDSRHDLKTEALYAKNKILKFKQLRDFVVIINNYFENKFKNVIETKIQYFRKTTYRYTVPFVNNEYGKRNRSFYVPTIFNSLSEPLLKLEKINKLKKLLKQHFLQQTVR